MPAFATYFVTLSIAIWIATTALYFLGGFAIIAYARRHPERKIQPDKNDGRSRAKIEIKESIISIAFTSVCMSLAICLPMFGYTLWSPWDSWFGVLAGAAILIIGYDAWFYWAHRLLHTRRFIRYHRSHHISRAPTVWSTDAQTIVETLMIQSWMVLAVLIFPIPPLSVVLHRLYDHINGQLGHCGYEFFASPTTRRPWPMVCTTYHDQHHELYRWNYGNYTSLWDRLGGTLHPDYDRLVAMREGGGPIAAHPPSGPSR